MDPRLLPRYRVTPASAVHRATLDGRLLVPSMPTLFFQPGGPTRNRAWLAGTDLTDAEVADILAHLDAGDEVTVDVEYRPARRDGPDAVHRRYEQRAVLVEGHAGGVGEWLLDAGTCWQSGFFRDGFPSAKDPHIDWVASADTVVDCECDCDCDWYGPFGEVDPDQGVMRCPACVAAGHPPVLRSPVHLRP